MTGRPTAYTQELADRICADLASGKSLRKICDEDGTPHLASVLLWVAKGSRGDKRYAAFYEQYTHAREAQAEMFADELIDIADEGNRNEVSGQGLVIGDVQRAKLRVETRKWAISKLLPKKYGEKLHQEISGPNGKPIEISDAKAALLRGLVPNATSGGADTKD